MTALTKCAHGQFLHAYCPECETAGYVVHRTPAPAAEPVCETCGGTHEVRGERPCPDCTGKQPALQCQSVSEPTMRHPDDWDGAGVVRHPASGEQTEKVLYAALRTFNGVHYVTAADYDAKVAEFKAQLASQANTIRELREELDRFIAKAAVNMNLYMDLLMQVQNVVPGESRHDSAKRIICQHENQSHGPAQCDKAALPLDAARQGQS